MHKRSSLVSFLIKRGRQAGVSGVKLTRFEIEGWLELIGSPSVCTDLIVPGHVVYYLNGSFMGTKQLQFDCLKLCNHAHDYLQQQQTQ